MAKNIFKGVIRLDVRDSTPDWEPFTLRKAPEGAPNILIVLYDDTGLAAWSGSTSTRILPGAFSTLAHTAEQDRVDVYRFRAPMSPDHAV